MYQVIGWVMFLSAGIISFVGNTTEVGGEMIMLALGMAFGGGYLILRGRRHATLIGEHILADDHRPPIVYLRSFNGESRENRFISYLRAAFTGNQIAGNVPAWGPVEQYLLEQFFSIIGPYIAIGQPDEPIPHMGASRIYVEENHWHQRVIDLLQQSRLVILRSGGSPGLQWELDQLIKNVPPTKILLILTGRGKDYQAFRKWTNARFPKQLPVKSPDTRLAMFADDWTFIPLTSQSGLSETLTPLLQKNNIDIPRWKPSHMPRWRKNK